MSPAWWRFGRRHDELTEEIESHLAQAIQDRIARGESLEGATAGARMEFGNREVVRATTRDMWGWAWLEHLMLDSRYAVRKLRRAPGFAVASVLSLAIGIGATVTMYAVVDAADIRGLPYPHADQLFVLEQLTTRRPNPAGPEVVDAGPAPEPTTRAWLTSTHAFSVTSRVGRNFLSWVHDDERETLTVPTVEPQFFAMLGARPIIGRTIAPSDTNADAAAVIVLNYDFWRDRLGSDRHIVGQRLDLVTAGKGSSHAAYTVVGVMPEKIDYPAAVNGWTARRSGTDTRAVVLGRLADSATIEAAVAELRAVMPRLPAPAGSTKPANIRATRLHEWLRVTPPRDDTLTIDSTKGRAVRLTVVCFVLLIATINVGNLLLARWTARDLEMVVRSALGASLARLAQQLLVEGAIMALVGGSIGITIASWGIRLTGSFGSLKSLAIVPTLDWRVLAFGLALTSIVALGAGFIPLLSLVRGTRPGRPASSATSASRPQTRTQGVLLAVQVGAALTLLTGAGVLGKELLRLERQGFGFDPVNVVWFPFVERPAGVMSAEFRESALFQLGRVPGVASVAEIEMIGSDAFHPVGDSAIADNTIFGYQDIAVSAGFLRSLRIPVVLGRDFSESEYALGAPVAVVSSSTAEAFWPGQNPLGRQVVAPPRMKLTGDTAAMEPVTLTVVGVIGNLRLGRVVGPPPKTLIRPVGADVSPGAQFLVRTTSDPQPTIPALRRIINSAQGRPLIHALYGGVETAADRQLAEQKLTTRALMTFAAVALLLATLGIHGLVAYTVTGRTREIGIRMALGATAGSVLLLVTRRGLLLAAAGIAVGFAGAFALSSAIRAMLYGTSPTDPAVFVGSAVLMVAVVLVASYFPARHAARVDPMSALRAD